MASFLLAFTWYSCLSGKHILSITIDPKVDHMELYWKNDSGEVLKSIQNLKQFVEQHHQKLLFAMNAGMYNKDLSPKGLFIQNYKTLTQIDTTDGEGNFYLQPNGVFYLNDDKTADIDVTKKFHNKNKIKFATQSGPMLVIDGAINSAFNKESKNNNIRNGVGILPDNKIIFALSKTEINLYNFAKYFQSKGCKSALYLDGFVSRAYYPEANWIQTDGNFGAMIGITTNVKNPQR
jgi:uncharacterized protein YigE (DUF2233 family)